MSVTTYERNMELSRFYREYAELCAREGAVLQELETLKHRIRSLHAKIETAMGRKEGENDATT